MRFSRANPSGVSAYGDNDDSRTEDAQHHGAAPVPQGQTGQVVTLRAAVESNAADSAGDEFGPPAWQQYFFLAPNVRFTRTPDADKRPAPQPDDEAPAKAAPIGDSIRPAPPAPSAANPVRAIPTAASAKPPQAVAAPRAAAPSAQKPQPPKFRWSYLSDDAFFEFSMPLLAER
ncbi:MAG: hypothetical protein E5V89_26680, partial [Mesorhizobium sp.]